MSPFCKRVGCLFILIGVSDIACDLYAMWHAQSFTVLGMIGMILGICIVALGTVLIDPEAEETILRWVGLMAALMGKSLPSELPIPPSKQAIDEEVKKHDYVKGATEPPPPPDEWNTSIREVLHQASLYSTPTYYLDRNLNIVDWNLAFGVLFNQIIGSLRMTHVNWFISKLNDPEKVFQHAKRFSERNPLPMVDTETLNYTSKRYGPVQLVKFASQLHDEQGRERGWTVSLFIRRIGNWKRYREDISAEFIHSKLWSYYAASYDRVLLEYPPYLKLQQMVTRAVPRGNHLVADIGAGTGNTTAALLDRGHSVWAVENNVVMLDCLRNKNFDPERVKIIKSSAEHLEILAEQSRQKPFDAIVMVNVLYALDDPLACLKSLNRLMRTGGILAFSTTHKESRLAPLLADIETHLVGVQKMDQLRHDFQCVYTGNMLIESMAIRHSREDYLRWVNEAGFEVQRQSPTEYPDKQKGVVMVVHARKRVEVAVGSGSSFSEFPLLLAGNAAPTPPPSPLLSSSWPVPKPDAGNGATNGAGADGALAPGQDAPVW